MDHLVLTVFAPDKPGQVERIAQCIAEQGGNWLESRMSRMAGQFAGFFGWGCRQRPTTHWWMPYRHCPLMAFAC